MISTFVSLRTMDKTRTGEKSSMNEKNEQKTDIEKGN
jgi:hypothetical protein